MHGGIERVITHLLSLLNVSLKSVEKVEDSMHTVFLVRTEDSGRLIGPSGEHLRALNMLVRRLAEKRVPESAPFIVDVNGYYLKKFRLIRQQAKLLAERARTFKTAVEMNPMNAYERMVVHALFTDDPELYTESAGEGKARHVVIHYRAAREDSVSSDKTLLEG